MGRDVTAKEAAALLLAADNIAILCHRSPDGDTVGSGFGMYHALKSLGKRAMVRCNDPIPLKYSYFTCETETFEPEFYLFVDIADEKLLGDDMQHYAGKCDLCLDHHPSNTHFAKALCLRADYGAACELVYDVIREMGVNVNRSIADSLYTGIATDTGCFRFSNTGVHTLRTAADLVEAGADSKTINNILFEIKSRVRLTTEQMAMETLEYACDARCAMMTISLELMAKSGASNEDLEGVAGLPRQIEGVDIGLTLRQQGEPAENRWKVSVRTSENADASLLCKQFGGGGHARAAGCEFRGVALADVKRQLFAASKQILEG